MQADGEKPGPVLAGEPARGDDPQQHGAGKQQQCDNPGRPGGVPKGRSVEGETHEWLPLPVASAGQPATVTITPPRPARRAGKRWLASQPGARSPRMIAAVLAVFASTQVAATTLTVRQQELTGIPVLGSMMWCSRAVPRDQART